MVPGQKDSLLSAFGGWQRSEGGYSETELVMTDLIEVSMAKSSWNWLPSVQNHHVLEESFALLVAEGT